MAIAAGEKDLSAALLGGKGRSLTEMKHMGIPVPPGFTVSTTAARAFMEHQRLPERLGPQMVREIKKIESEAGKRFGDVRNPLLVSVRSGAEVSMPGMMDTVLNLGLNPDTVEGLARQTGSERFAYDCYRRFLAMFGNVVLKIDRGEFEDLLEGVKQRRQIELDADLQSSDLGMLCEMYRRLICLRTGLSTPPDDPWEQLAMATVAVFQSWNNDRAKLYRKAHLIPDSKGTAVTVQAMVFGNRGEDSGTGVVFSNNVSTGERGMYGEFLSNAQGEDVVAGIRTPLPISRLHQWNGDVYKQLDTIVAKLAEHYDDTVDVEFTVEQGALYILQARAAKRTFAAQTTELFRKVRNIKDPSKRALAIRAAIPLEALLTASQPSFDAASLAEAEKNIIAEGLAVSPGAAVGTVALSSKSAQEMAKYGTKVILVRPDTSPDDLPGMMAATAIVTETSGATSHAAVVARGMNKPAIAGASGIRVIEGEIISIDGSSGKVYRGTLPLSSGKLTKEVELLVKWAKENNNSSEKSRAHLSFEMMDAQVSTNKLCNDFYLSDAMALAARGTPLSLETLVERRKIHEKAAQLIATYLTVAVAGELRHQENVRYYNSSYPKPTGSSSFDFDHHPFGDDDDDDNFYPHHSSTDSDLEEARQAREVLWSEFGMQNGAGRQKTQTTTAANLKNKTTKDHIRFLDSAQTVFEKAIWNSSFGGPAWANIAKAANEYLAGHIGPTEFVDHAFDLEHNGGCVFGKQDNMLHGDNGLLKMQLEKKKYAKDIRQLYRELKKLHPAVSPEIQQLLAKGVQANIWKID